MFGKTAKAVAIALRLTVKVGSEYTQVSRADNQPSTDLFIGMLALDSEQPRAILRQVVEHSGFLFGFLCLHKIGGCRNS